MRRCCCTRSIMRRAAPYPAGWTPVSFAEGALGCKQDNNRRNTTRGVPPACATPAWSPHSDRTVPPLWTDDNEASWLILRDYLDGWHRSRRYVPESQRILLPTQTGQSIAGSNG